ncbi:type II secretion system protein [Candidatus Peregrinibacteria bacterium]|nr:type II secretion system protein [Candidatus Peregrinibacteria bacterium]MBT4631420.1 type II secretion system protein [Candidatus Peregrinibacteria bacterium]MBT5516929.1 type II secretion system protein [Candidatus Peregrinibacteria bacterium]MBT5823995.1 type II secretion system protein [Candidatus Peregrinibacteria bacterium]
MKSARHTKPAFTLIEVIVVTSMVAILSMGFALNIDKIRKRGNFHAVQNEIVGVLQNARSLSLSNQLRTNEGDGIDYPVKYYRIMIKENGLGLDAYLDMPGADPLPQENLTLVDFDSMTEEDFSIIDNMVADRNLLVFYFPPYGEICFNNKDCSSASIEKTFRFHTDDDEFATEMTLSIHGGTVEINEEPDPLEVE